MTCDLTMTSEVHYHDQGQVNATYHFKILVPSVAAGAIIGKGGETIAQLQKEAGARVKMSKATDFYPGTTERVCLITGSIEGILRIHEFIMEKIKEKPDPNSKMAIDFDHKQPAEREKQVKILVPNSTAGIIIGKGGSYIKDIKEESGAYVQISQKSKDHALAERCITVIGEMERNKAACRMILSKIVEDPQSGSCLNISYADVTGPVANFNPTGSPFANPENVPSGAVNTTSNPSYSSNGSMSSLSPTSFHQTSHSESNHLIEAVKNLLRGHGYSEQALQDICAALTTLAGYGLLVIGLTILNGIGSSQDVFPSDGSNLFGPIGSVGPRPSETPSPSALPVNHNSFGLGTRLQDSATIEVEVGENIVGAILGPGGQALVEIQRFSGANIQISKKGIFAPGTRNRIVVISGLSSAVSTAQYLIERQIVEEEAKRAQQNVMGMLH